MKKNRKLKTSVWRMTGKEKLQKERKREERKNKKIQEAIQGARKLEYWNGIATMGNGQNTQPSEEIRHAPTGCVAE